jgi:hypothetical protein
VKDGKLCAFGPIAENNWQVPIEKITHLQILHSKGECPTLQLSTGNSIHVVYGLRDSESLLELLPKSIFQTDFAHLRIKLDECIDALFKVESEAGSLDRKELLTNSILEALKECPEAKLLVPNYHAAIHKMYVEMVVIVFIAFMACVATPSTLLWGIPLLLLALRAYVLRIEKTSSCLYVICADGLFELNYRKGIVNKIELHELRLKNPKGACLWLRFPGFVEIPLMQMDQAFARLKICVKDREFKV